MERILSPLNVGVDIGSRGVGDSAGEGVGLGDAATVGDGDGDGLGGSCAVTTIGERISSEIRDSTNLDRVINSFLLL
jgi:hypothetical protein